MDKLEKLIKLFPLFATLLIFLGFSNLYYFYLPFGVNIYSYLNNSEIIFSFLPNLQIIIIWSAILLIFIISWITFFAKAFNINTSDNDLLELNNEEVEKKEVMVKNEKSSFSQRLKLKLVSLRRRLFPENIKWVISLILFTIFLWKTSNPCEEPDVFYPFLMAWTLFVILFILKALKYNQLLGLGISSIVVFFGLLIFFATNNHCKAELVKNGVSNIKITFTHESEIIKTDSVLLYVGGTQNYLFLYNTKEQETLIFNKSKVSKIKVKRINK